MSEWQPIGTAPKDGTRFLAWHKGRVDFFHWQDLNGRCDAPVGWRDSFIYVFPEFDSSGPTHWIPLPDAPPKPIEPEPARDDKTIDMFSEAK